MSSTLPHTLVKDCMSRELVTVTPYDTLARAYELMTANRIRRLPVVDGAKLTGIITLSDLLELKPPDPTHRMALADIARELGRLVVSAVMTRDPVCVYDNDTVGHVAELLLNHKIGGLPVIDTEGHLLGLITESNLFQLIAKRWRDDNLSFSGAHSH